MSIVVCIGNELVADDAVGHEIYTRMAEMSLPDVSLEYCGVGGVALLDLLDGSQETMIVVDAVCFGAPAGTVHRIEFGELAPSDANAISAHGIGLRETIEIGMALYPERMPKRVTLVGIEGRCFDLPREHMPEAVDRATQPAVAEILSLLHLSRPSTNPAGINR